MCMGVCVWGGGGVVCACMHPCVEVYMCACVHALVCMHEYTCVCACTFHHLLNFSCLIFSDVTCEKPS